MKVSFYTLGCKVNQYETEMIRETFEKNGYTVVSNETFADVIIINSCTVTAESDRKTRQAVRHYRALNPNAIIILCGCMPQASPEKAYSLIEADIIIGNSQISNIPLLVNKYLNEKERILGVTEHTKDEIFNTPVIENFSERTRAFMKIEDGCERYCTYCIIPKSRGRVRSKPIGEIRSEAEKLAENGFCEIVLVGINLSAYGKGTNNNICDAVEAVCSVPKIKRVRLGSLEPDHISDSMLSRLALQSKFCPQFHLSLQSGCDKTLKHMNRHYDTAFYKDLVNRIRKTFDNASITTDIMVGFAGETQNDFEESVAFLKEIGFAKTHVFAYSRREGTAAYGYPLQVDNKTKSERSKIMIKAAEECEAAFLNSQIGKRVCVLFETFENGIAYGHTPNYCNVKVKSDISLNNKLYDVEIFESQGEYLIGNIV